ncbi:sulfotransferase [uncultured Methylophaga sp.]|uniref:sulfotransferase family protein n=1 Tax=uncultured Methylophaga sp. TaxID=285271 RepID=UPI00260331F0|nr:sulfotransferase [uncultured Methylophaga sp.]
MTRSSFLVGLARIIQAVPLWVFQFIERPFLVKSDSQKVQAIFVMALPRSGSTVLYQAISHGLAVQYLSNVWNLLYQLPLLGGRISACYAAKHRSGFQSSHGFVPGIDGPAEGMRFWQRWLGAELSDKNAERGSEKKLQRRVAYLRHVIASLKPAGQPFVSTYIGHSLIPDRVHEAFPEAVLIRLRRDPVSNGLSLLKSMRESRKDSFSVIPRECHDLRGASQHEWVAAQVYWLNRRLDDAACSSNMLSVNYEDFCRSPTNEIKRIHDWCLSQGVEVELKFPLPDSFTYKMADCDNDIDALKIQQALAGLEQKYGKLGATP